MTKVEVPIIDLKAQYLSIKEEVDGAVARVHEKGNYVSGDEVRQFEQEWAKYCGARYCVATSSGTDALYLAVRALREIAPNTGPFVVPAFTFIATYEAVVRAGGMVAIEDVAEDTATMISHAELKFETFPSMQPVAVPVHLYGYPADIEKNEALTIEDAAQAHGQQLRGTVACYSFYPTKNLGAMGQAGALVTNGRDLYDIAASLRNHGEGKVRFQHNRLSGNYRMDELQAAILRAKLPHLDDWNQKRRDIAFHYRQAFWNGHFQMQPVHVNHVYHVFALRHSMRDELGEFLEKKGIQTAVRYPRPIQDEFPVIQAQDLRGKFPNASKWARQNLNLPIYPEMPDSHEMIKGGSPSRLQIVDINPVWGALH